MKMECSFNQHTAEPEKRMLNQLIYSFGISGVNDGEMSQPQLALFGLFGEDVVFKGMLPFELSRGGFLKTLRGP